MWSRHPQGFPTTSTRPRARISVLLLRALRSSLFGLFGSRRASRRAFRRASRLVCRHAFRLDTRLAFHLAALLAPIILILASNRSRSVRVGAKREPILQMKRILFRRRRPGKRLERRGRCRPQLGSGP